MDIREALAKFLSQQPFTRVVIDFADKTWYYSQVPAKPGWYFLETTTPLAVLQRIDAPPAIFLNSKGEEKKTRNFNLGTRALRYDGSKVQEVWLTTKVYSGMARNLCARAREHTFAHPGTASLALANYRELHQYVWEFWYATSETFNQRGAEDETLLRLGEQIWRAQNGWPVLCAY